MRITLQKGLLIVFEGTDCVGKTTLQENIFNQFDAIGFDCIKTKEPTDGQYGQRIRQSAMNGRLLPNVELNLFIEDRKEHIKNVIEPALQRGKIILQDRYYLSTAAYQGARGLDCENILKINEAFAPEPDMCILLEIPQKVFIQRLQKRSGIGDLFEELDEQKIIADNFKKICRNYITRFNGTLPSEILMKMIMKTIFLGPLIRQINLITDPQQRKTAFDGCTDAIISCYF